MCFTGQKEYVIFEPLVRELQIQPLPHVDRDEHKPLAPQGRFNEYVIDGHFHGFKQPVRLHSVFTSPVFLPHCVNYVVHNLSGLSGGAIDRAEGTVYNH